MERQGQIWSTPSFWANKIHFLKLELIVWDIILIKENSKFYLDKESISY